MLVSICIPVYNGEKFLNKCLESIAAQTYKNFEIIVVDDCSNGKNEKGWNCKKICRIFGKQNKVKINYLRNSQNLGCLEARRYAIYEAKGEYILCVDCDDVLGPDCLEKLVSKALETQADIVQCGAKVVFTSSNPEVENNEVEILNKDSMQKKANLLFNGVLEGDEVFDSLFFKNQVNSFVWGKLIKKEVYISAWEQIPSCYCVWGEDFIIFFFAAYFAKKYAGITDELYVYSVDTGISSSRKIETLEDYKKICSVSSVFVILFDAIAEGNVKITAEQKEALQAKCNTYVLSNFRYLKYFVAEEIKKEAYEAFLDFWGSEYTLKVLDALNETLEIV